MGATLRLVDRVDGTGHVVDLALESAGARRTATARVGFELSAREREDVRWYLEDYLQYPVEPAPAIARGIEARLAELGGELFRQVFEADRNTMGLWAAVEPALADARVEVATGAAGAAGIPWELLRDPATGGVLSVRTEAFVRGLAEAAGPVAVPQAAETLRVLLVICRPGGAVDVPFRSVASHLVRLSRGAREVFELQVLRPPTFAQLARVLQAAKIAGAPYHVVHFDGHGTWADSESLQAAAAAEGPEFDRERFSVLSEPRAGSHGYLVFEDPAVKGNQLLVDGPALGQLLADTGVPVLVLNACRSAHAGLATEPEHDGGTGLDAHRRVRAYGSLAQEVMDAGVAGVVAMAYNVYVVTAAQFIGNVYAALLEGRELGQAVTAARRQLAASPLRQISLQARPLQDWLVPVVFEAAPVTLHAIPPAQGLVVSLSQTEAGQERASLDPAVLAEPDVGFYGRDETLLALDRAFDTSQVVLLHAWAGGGKTSTAVEFARWYALTGGAQDVLFSVFTRHLPLPRLLDQIGDRYGPALEQGGVDWATLDEDQRREVALQVLAQVRLLWIWDNVEPVAGFPAGTPSAWTPGEQHELAAFLRDLAQRAAGSGCKVLLTSRRDEQAWLGDLPTRIALPAMPMLERLELAKAVASRQTGTAQRFLDVQDWRPLLEFTQGNPLTVTVLARQAIRDHRTSKDQIQAFVDELRSGAATVTDDAAQGRGASLAASLDYGFSHAFTDPERAQLAVLALFQGFIDVDALRAMGSPDQPAGPVPALAGLERQAGIALLDRAAETGLLTPYGGGYYAVHPAVPWHLHRLFEHHYGGSASPAARQAVQAWTAAVSSLGEYWLRRYSQGHAEVIGFLGAEEDNLLRARQLARRHGWWDQLMGAMQGLRTLYGHTGRTVEWRRLVDELTPDLADPATAGPRPGREDQWSVFISYRIDIARDARDWPAAQELQQAVISWDRQQAADALVTPPEQLSAVQRNQIDNLAVDLHDLAQMLRDQDDPGCVPPYEESIRLSQRIGDRSGEANVTLNLGNAYTGVPALRDLDRAQYCYQRAGELFGEHDTFGQAKVAGQLGQVAYERFRDARNAGEPVEQLARHLTDAETAYQRVLKMLPSGAVSERATTHNQLGIVYDDAGDTDAALRNYQQAIQYCERQDNPFIAGQTRYNAALALINAGRYPEALLYAQAALRDFQSTGPGAAGRADLTRQLIERLEGELAGEPDPNTDQAT
jgi:tetratricopeptide (TPR) repeat protein